MSGRIMEMSEIIQELIKYEAKSISGSCMGCAYEDREEWDMPCRKCQRNCKDFWRVKGDNDGKVY